MIDYKTNPQEKVSISNNMIMTTLNNIQNTISVMKTIKLNLVIEVRY